MATKQYAHETFNATIVVNGKPIEFRFYAHTTNTRQGFCHTIDFVTMDYTALNITSTKCSYYNRTWESFRYETVLQCCIKKLPKAYREQLQNWVKEYSQGIAQHVQKQLEAFTSAYNKLSEDSKAQVAKTFPNGVHTEEEGKILHSMVAVMAI